MGRAADLGPAGPRAGGSHRTRGEGEEEKGESGCSPSGNSETGIGSGGEKTDVERAGEGRKGRERDERGERRDVGAIGIPVAGASFARRNSECGGSGKMREMTSEYFVLCF